MRKTFRNKKKSRKTRKRGGASRDPRDNVSADPVAKPSNDDKKLNLGQAGPNEQAGPKEQARPDDLFEEESPPKTSSPKSSKSDNNIFKTDKISMQSNQDSSYKERGIVHMSQPGSVNVVRGFGTDVANIFGRKGFDESKYTKTRQEALKKLEGLLEPGQKVCNLKVDTENVKGNSLYFIHLYGTLLEISQ